MYPLRWGATLPSRPTHLRDWLQFSGSFIQRLKQHGVRNPSIQVVQQSWQYPSPEDRQRLSMPVRRRAWVRDVLIKSDQHVWMFAQSIFPYSSLTGKEKQLARLKNRTLGSVLFRHRHMQRSPFEFANLSEGHPLHTYMVQTIGHTVESLWSRRSLFLLGKKSLLLTEVFLPSVFRLREIHGSLHCVTEIE